MSSDKVKSFRAKFMFSHATNGSNEMFSNVKASYLEKSASFDSETLGSIRRKNDSYFSKCDLQLMDWVRNLFLGSIFIGHLPINEQEKFMELKTDRTFSENRASTFLEAYKNPLISKYTIAILTPFAYL